jgi:predicted transcriptional regulator
MLNFLLEKLQGFWSSINPSFQVKKKKIENQKHLDAKQFKQKLKYNIT